LPFDHSVDGSTQHKNTEIIAVLLLHWVYITAIY
jgi:hypothetical protein